MSNGLNILKSKIDYKVRKAKQKKLILQLNEYGYNFCEECVDLLKNNNAIIIERINEMDFKILDCSHIDSVDSCQKNGYSEKAWEINNIKILCRFHHRKHDNS